MAIVELVASELTEWPPCALAFCPLDSRFLVVGTYQLEQDGSRHGALVIYDCFNDKLKQVNSVNSADSSILDLKFSPHDASLLVSAHSTGKICLWRCIVDDDKLKVDLITTYKVADSSGILALSVCFSIADPTKISVTLSSGEWKVVSLTSTKMPSLITAYAAHSLEAWTSAFSSNGSVLYSGGDDSCLSAFDLRMDVQVWKDSRSHGAGVTAILPFQGNDMTLWTGSYDESLRMWDVRGTYGRGKVVDELPLGGGVWRLIPCTASDMQTDVLACCMHGGSRILSSADEATKCYVDAYITDNHDSMVYGGDWTPDGESIATCSFYDKKLNFWSVS
ncbi:WD40-repeat-containing domain protein [Lipomyces arxii]|uniref:WD40-repeat-containing domain protein n=1 Tax=Lipomyces arxii TaxID=56418 RepID=UPI0034CDCB9B